MSSLRSLIYTVTIVALLLHSFQGVDRSTVNEVRKFVFSGPLTPGGVALRDITYVRK